MFILGTVSQSYNNLAVLYQEKGQLEKAIQQITKAIQKNPNTASFYRNRGLMWKQQNKLDKAIKDLEKASRLYQNQGKPQAAKAINETLNQLR